MSEFNPEKKPPTGLPTTKQKQDEAIIGTNDYSIVSKRSVEKIYYPEEPQFFEPFIGRDKRRAPLINRGYWLRMQAIEQVVLQFLDEKSERKKVIVNLGCGYEPLPFRMLWKYGNRCRTVRFIDVDYPQLIEKKLDVVKKNHIYSDLLTQPVSGEAHSSILLNDGRYCAVSCDLGDTKALDHILRTELHLDESLNLFIGEVSIVYMEVKPADQLIKLCATFDNARFCLLEQHLPEGPSHPFAKTMLDHFQKQTPLRCLESYNSIESQNTRFHAAGWREIKTKDLWSLWQDPAFAPAERMALESVEPFDEWEELALFAGHYFLLMATTSSTPLKHISEHTMDYEIPYKISPPVEILQSPNPAGQGLRRFGASFNVNEETVVFHGGLKSLSKQPNHDIYTLNPSTPNTITTPPENILCHTITPLNPSTSLLTGGRNSPSKANPSCFLYNNKPNKWTQTHNLLPPRYRHCSTQVQINKDPTPAILTFGGKTSTGQILKTWSLYTQTKGWEPVTPTNPNEAPPPLFGASLATTNKNGTTGLLLGGMKKGGVLHAHFTTWHLFTSSPDTEEEETCKITFSSTLPRLNEVGIPSPATLRFGASLVPSRWGLLLIGGIGPRGPLPSDEEVLVVRKYGRIDKFEERLFDGTEGKGRPLLVGFGAVSVQGGDVLIVGGSAVCFSFGAFWNEASYLLGERKEGRGEEVGWKLLETVEA
ncbi:leucine carboxyl methyltransferase 2 [Venturia nashicola]|nr:leucine carboxyl methyltransferase 2 [Venturia nashicola]